MSSLNNATLLQYRIIFWNYVSRGTPTFPGGYIPTKIHMVIFHDINAMWSAHAPRIELKKHCHFLLIFPPTQILWVQILFCISSFCYRFMNSEKWVSITQTAIAWGLPTSNLNLQRHPQCTINWVLTWWFLFAVKILYKFWVHFSGSDKSLSYLRGIHLHFH